jgi:hypothetical protein
MIWKWCESIVLLLTYVPLSKFLVYVITKVASMWAWERESGSLWAYEPRIFFGLKINLDLWPRYLDLDHVK